MNISREDLTWLLQMTYSYIDDEELDNEYLDKLNKIAKDNEIDKNEYTEFS